MAIASLVLGIVGLVFTLLSAGFLGLVGVICGIVGVILGAMARNQGQGNMAVAGLVLSIIALALGGVTFIACGCPACMAACAIADAANQLQGLY